MMANVVAAWTGNNVVDAVTRVVDELALPGSLRGDYTKSNRTKTTDANENCFGLLEMMVVRV